MVLVRCNGAGGGAQVGANLWLFCIVFLGMMLTFYIVAGVIHTRMVLGYVNGTVCLSVCLFVCSFVPVVILIASLRPGPTEVCCWSLLSLPTWP